MYNIEKGIEVTRMKKIKTLLQKAARNMRRLSKKILSMIF